MCIVTLPQFFNDGFTWRKKYELGMISFRISFWTIGSSLTTYMIFCRLLCLCFIGGDFGKSIVKRGIGSGDSYRVLLIDDEHHTESLGNEMNFFFPVFNCALLFLFPCNFEFLLFLYSGKGIAKGCSISNSYWSEEAISWISWEWPCDCHHYCEGMNYIILQVYINP